MFCSFSFRLHETCAKETVLPINRKSLNRTISFEFTEAAAERLFEFLGSYHDGVKIVAALSDNSNLVFNSIREFKSFPNSTLRRLEAVTFSAEDYGVPIGEKPRIRVKFLAHRSSRIPSFEYEIEGEDETVQHISQQVEEAADLVRIDHKWYVKITQRFGSTVCLGLLTILGLVGISGVRKAADAWSGLEGSVLAYLFPMLWAARFELLWIFFSFAIFGWSFYVATSFPRTMFAIGAGARRCEEFRRKHEWVQKTFFGVLGSLIATLLVSIFNGL